MLDKMHPFFFGGSKVKHILFLLGSVLFSFQVAASDCVTIGAIRWDAWHGGQGSKIGKVVEDTLSPVEYRPRSPFCSTDNARGELDINCSTADAIEKEINYAEESGLSYWAFLKYPEDNPMSRSLQRYLSSKSQNRINFSLILTPNSLNDPKYTLADNISLLAALAAKPNYQRVKEGRPLFFFLPEGGAIDRESNTAWMNDVMIKFRSAFLKQGLQNPYFVLMHFNPQLGAGLANKFGFDALSTYAIHGNGKGAPYQSLTHDAHAFWDRVKATGSKLVPTAMAGWDRRPRVVRPVPWEAGQVVRNDEIEYYYQQPKPDELATHVQEAMHWVNANPSTAEANAVLIYAWNENDEGGWIVPTLGEGDIRVRALGAAINKECHRGN